MARKPRPCRALLDDHEDAPTRRCGRPEVMEGVDPAFSQTPLCSAHAAQWAVRHDLAQREWVRAFGHWPVVD